MAVEVDTSSKDLVDLTDKADAAFDDVTSTAETPAAAQATPVSAVPSGPPPAETPVASPEAQTGPPPAQSQGSAPPAYSKDVNDLLLKHGGDLQAAARHYFDLQNQNAELNRKIEEASHRPAEPPSAPAQVESLAPEVQRFDSRLRAIEGERKILEDQYATKVASQNDLQGKIDETLELLTSNEIETDYQALTRELKKLRGQKARVDSDISKIKATAASQDNEYLNIITQKDLAVKVLSLSQAREAEVYAHREREVSDFRSSFDHTVEAISQAKIPKDLHDEYKEWVEAMTFRFLRTPTGTDDRGNPVFENTVQDLPAYLTAQADRFLQTQDKYHRVKSAEYSQLKVADATVNSGNGATVAPETKRLRSVAEFDARDEELDLDSFGAQA
jgi:hypothetical protein